jgi:peptide chain release factor 2
LLRERTRLERAIEGYRRIEREVDDAVGLIELGDAEGDKAIVAEAEANLEKLREEARKREVESLLSGEADGNDCYLEVHAGAGGTEAQDWAEMLLRMYVRWAEDHDYKVEWLEESAGEGAGIKSATVKVSGVDAYGWLKTESGVHRLVRISPFDSQARRQTSFASLLVVPFLEDLSDEVDIDEKDLRIDYYRSSGAGGQHVNVTDSAVRLTHNPTGIVVTCQNERSQHQNKAKAMQILAAKLADLQRQQRKAELQEISGPQTQAGWGNAFRHYVQAPYQLVKDDRTGYETGNVQAVLDGDLDAFMEAFLRWRRASADQ